MNSELPEDAGGAVGEENIGRLLSRAYKPEAPEGAFAADVRARMLAAANATNSSAGAAGNTQGGPVMNYRIPRIMVAWSAIAAVLLVALGVYVVQLRNEAQRMQANIVWIDDKPYQKAKDGTLVEAPASKNAPAQEARPEDQGLNPKARPAEQRAEQLAVGAEVKTGEGRRKRVVLPDGSVILVDENTVAKLDADRRLTVGRGKVFVEVSPRNEKIDGATFVVKTPGREVSALGTKFQVAVGDAGTRVLVTQGKVKASGVNVPINAGQQLTGEKDEEANKVVAAPRADEALDWAKELIGEAETPLVPRSRHEGGALIVVDPNGQEMRLSLRKYHVDVHVEDGFARTTIDQTYFNHENRRLEGTFYFPIPAEAQISRLAMYVDGKLMEGGMAERQHAANVYESIVYTRRDPALLEWIDGTTFKMRVFPLEARQEKRILISYTQKLPEAYAQSEYRFPAGHNLGLVNAWSFHGVIKNGANLAWASDTVGMTATTIGGDLVLDAKAEMIKPEADVVVHMAGAAASQSASIGESARFSAAEHESGKYFMLRFRPKIDAPPQRERRDWVFLFEASGNRDPLLARVQADVIRTMLENAEHDDTFNIVTAGTRTRAFAKESVAATPENVRAAVAFLDKTHLVGALDLGVAIGAAGAFAKGGKNPYLVHVGTGIPTIGERKLDALVKRLPGGVKYVGVGVGRNWSRQFMKDAATRTAGHYVNINPDESTTWRAFQLMATLNTPRLQDVAVTDGAGNAYLLFEESLAHGEELTAVTKPKGDRPTELTVSGSVDGRPYQRVVPVVDVATKADYLPRAHAKLEIDRLVAEGAEKNKDAIVALSKAMYVMSPFTSLLVLENDEMYTQFNIDRGRKDHWANYPAPAQIKVVTEPLGAENMIEKPKAPTDRLPVEQVLQTVMVRVPVRGVTWNNQYGYNYSGQTVTAWDVNGAGHMLQGIDPGARGWNDEDRSGSLRGRQMDAFRFRKGVSDGTTAVTRGTMPTPPTMSFGGAVPTRQPGRPMVVNGPVATRSPRGAQAIDGLSSLRAQSQSGQQQAGGRASGRTERRLEMFSRDARGDVRLKDGVKKESAARSNLGWANQRAGGKDKRAQLAGDRMAGEELAERITHGYGQQNFLYQRPHFSGDWRVFADLLQYAPALNTSDADIRAVLDAEAVLDSANEPGKIDDAARKLIDAHRNSGWHTITIPASDGRPFYVVTFDGTGRCTYTRLVSDHLEERVICDGKTLLHLYPELGLAGRRNVTPHHLGGLQELAPWVLPPVEELARGADVSAGGERAVTVTPKGAPDAKDEQGKPLAYVKVELAFAEDGRLAERRVIEMPSAKVIHRETYSADGVVVLTDADGKEVRKLALSLKKAAVEPSLTADTKDLVVLDFPIRSRNHVFATRKLQDDGKYDWSEADALAVVLSNFNHSHWNTQQIIGTRFFRKGDRRIGFYVLMMAHQSHWEPKQELHLGNDVRVVFDPEKDHPKSALAAYVVDQLEMNRQSYNATVAQGKVDADGKFVDRMAALRYMFGRWMSGRANQGTQDARRVEHRRLLDYVKTCNDPMNGWMALTLVMNYGHDATLYGEMAAAAKGFSGVPQFEHMARYEHARFIANAGKWEEARKLYKELYADALNAGALPQVDHQFRQTLGAVNNLPDEWADFMRQNRETVVKQHGRAAGVSMAFQTYQLGDAALAEELFASATAEVPADERFSLNMTMVDYLWNTGQHARADKVLEPLLADKQYAEYPELWRLASAIAAGRGQLARALSFQERALDLDFGNMPELVNLEAIRQDYAMLLGRYQQLADAIATLEKEPSRELMAKVIKAADRWRSLDPEPEQACQYAANVLQRMGQAELAWDYLTTPLADKPNESSPWTGLGQALRQQGEFALAEKAFATAYDIEPTNAQILWDRAMVLQQSNRFAEAREVFKQIADGQWQPRFQWVQRQAKQYVKQ